MGYARVAVVGAPALECVNPGDVAAYVAVSGGLTSGRAARALAGQRYRERDGRWVWLGISGSLTDERAAELGVRRASSVLEVAAGADIVSVHLALTDDTRGLLDREFFAAMRDRAYLVNTPRGEVADEAA